MSRLRRAAHIQDMTASLLEVQSPESLALPLGEGVLCGPDGEPVIVDLCAHDTLVIARLQDVEDHPDAWPEER